MLPGLKLGSTPGSTPGSVRSYTRRPGWSQPVESLWAILAKWQFVNRLPYATVARCVSSLSAGGLYQGVDLRLLEAFDLDALARFSGIQLSALCAGACVATSSSPALALTSTHLRWCQACMDEGFHAALFQFFPITCCPIHRVRLIQVCPNCKISIPYRLDPAAAATPLACPSCSAPLVADWTVLARRHQATGVNQNLAAWQQLLARYAKWYCNVAHVRQPVLAQQARPHANTLCQNDLPRDRLSFIGALQEVLHKAPRLASNAELRQRTAGAVMPESKSAFDVTWKVPFSKQQWPHFHTAVFIELCRRFDRRDTLHRQHDVPRDRRTTAWWRRTWQGATARHCLAHTIFDVPPFGVAEWFAFSTAPAPQASGWATQHTLMARFEQDLQLTWLAWSELLKQMPSNSSKGLHPRLIPPRGCWLSEPSFLPSSTALGV
jgi:hypothetical protein